MSDFVKTACVIILVGCLVYAYAYNSGYKKGYGDVKNELLVANNQFLQKVRELENNYIKTQNEVIEKYEKQLQEADNSYKATLAHLNNYKFSDVVECVYNSNTTRSSVRKLPPNATDTRAFKCYTKEQLQRKVGASLAISRECDRLAIRYNELLELWKKGQN